MKTEIQELLEKLGVDKEVFNEDFTTQLGLLIEAKVGEHKKELEESLEHDNKKEIEAFKEDLIEKLDEYLNYFVEKFVEDNEEEIHNAVEVNTAKKVLEKFHGMVEQFNMELSDDAMINEEEVDELKEHLNDAVNSKITLEREVKELRKQSLVADFANQHIDVESEKASFTNLAENFEYEDDESFKDKLEYLKENINITKDSNSDDLEDQEVTENQSKTLEEADTTTNQSDGSNMKDYLKVLERTS